MIRIDSIWLATEPMDMRAGIREFQRNVLPFCEYSRKPSAMALNTT